MSESSYKVYASEEYVDQRVPPSPDGAHKMLVTGADGSTKWADRTHYCETAVKRLIDQGFWGKKSDDYGCYGYIYSSDPLVVGETYKVVYDNVEYECVAWQFEETIGIGNGNLIWCEGNGNNEPFCLIDYDSQLSIYPGGFDDADHYITVDGPGKVYHPIAEEYMPANYAEYVFTGFNATREEFEAASAKFSQGAYWAIGGDRIVDRSGGVGGAGNAKDPKGGMRLYTTNNQMIRAYMDNGEFKIDREPIMTNQATYLMSSEATNTSAKFFKLSVDDSATPTIVNVNDDTNIWTPVTDDHINDLIDSKLEGAHPTELITIPTSAWTGTEAPYFAMNQACSIATMTNTLSVSLSPTLTNPDDGMAEILSASTYNAIAKSKLMAVVQADGGITFAAYGKKPEIDIPVIVTEVG